MTYLDLINIKYHKNKFLILVSIIILLLIIYTLNLSMFDTYETFAYYSKNSLVVKINIEIPDTINTLEYIKIGKKLHKATMTDALDVEFDQVNLISYQTTYFKIDGVYKENQVFKIKILYNKEKIYKKLKKLLLS